LLTLTDNNQYLLVAPQGEGVLWIETVNMKKIHHNPKDVSITDIVQVNEQNLYAFAELSGKIHIIDRKKPTEIKMTFDAGNTIHKLASRGSLLYAACEDGFMRVFDASK
jgi:mannose/fructose/N-acetylgalactosamine-specific phosphotransferase system component IIB